MERFGKENLTKALQDPKTQRKAFEEMVRTYSPTLYSQIRRMVLSHDDTDDILQNTFLKAWTNISSFRGEAQLSTWLYRIAMNETLTFINRQKEAIPLDDPEASIANQLMADDYFDGDETEAHLMAAIQTLPPKQQEVFNLKYFSEMKYEDISDLLGTTVGALKASYHIAVKKIEEYLSNID